VLRHHQERVQQPDVLVAVAGREGLREVVVVVLLLRVAQLLRLAAVALGARPRRPGSAPSPRARRAGTAPAAGPPQGRPPRMARRQSAPARRRSSRCRRCVRAPDRRPRARRGRLGGRRRRAPPRPRGAPDGSRPRGATTGGRERLVPALPECEWRRRRARSTTGRPAGSRSSRARTCPWVRCSGSGAAGRRAGRCDGGTARPLRCPGSSRMSVPRARPRPRAPAQSPRVASGRGRAGRRDRAPRAAAGSRWGRTLPGGREPAPASRGFGSGSRVVGARPRAASRRGRRPCALPRSRLPP
jgi:hypothetical protein